jgi:23S rRNA (uracil1939-C5)-methyltransferase
LTETVLLDVERLCFGSEALAHRGGEVVFVAYGAPGDRVAAEIVERRRGWARARIASVVAPGPARVLPGCRWFPTCGGCQWQHVAPAAQRDAKAAIVAEQLARLGGVRGAAVLPTLASPADWGYRTRVVLVVEGRRAGYHRARSHTLLEIEDCPVAEPAVAAHLSAARAWVAALRVGLRRVAVQAVAGGVVLAGAATARPGPADLEASEAFLVRSPSVRGVVLAGGGVRVTAGDPTVAVALEPGLDLEVPADVFTQVNPGANRLLVAALVALGGFAAGERALDLYCGAGNFTLPLARRGVVVHGVERDPVAVAAARANAARHGLDAATFEAAVVAEALARARPGAADAVVLDPPRRGAREALPALVRLRPRRILYVSCDPATLARDARALAHAGYHIGRVQPVDLFPQTYHVESVAEFRLT